MENIWKWTTYLVGVLVLRVEVVLSLLDTEVGTGAEKYNYWMI